MFFRKRFVAAAGVAAAAGALVLAAGTSAFAAPTPAISFNVSAPGSISGQQGVALTTPEVVDYTFASFLSDATFKSTATGLDGLTFTADDVHHHDVIDGTPSGAGNGSATVTVTATKTYALPTEGALFDMTEGGDRPGGRTDCAYSLNGPTTFTVSSETEGPNSITVQITGLTINPQTGVFSYTVKTTEIDNGVTTVTTANGTAESNGYVLTGPDAGSSQGHLATALDTNNSVTKTCSDSVNIPWAFKAAPAPTPTPTVTVTPTSTGVPSGSVQTGGDAPVSDTRQVAADSLLGVAGLSLLGGIVWYRRVRNAQV